MTVSMDGLRWQLVRNYNSLTRKLNSKIIDKPHDPEIRIDPDRMIAEYDSLDRAIELFEGAAIQHQKDPFKSSAYKATLETILYPMK